MRLARWIEPKRKPPVLIKSEVTYGTEAPPATITDVLKAAGYREIPLVANRVPVVPRPAREIVLPNAAQLDHMRGVAQVHGAPTVKICRGSDKGCGGEDFDRCTECYTVQWWDKRPSGEILEALKRGDA